jgi:aminopeptidase-like protein
MNWIRPFAVLLVVPLLSQSQTLRTDPQLEKLIREVRAEVNPNEALDFVLRVRENDRWFNFPKFQETAEYIQKTMSAIGLRKVELVPTPADGMTQYGFWTMPLAWDVKHAVLEIIEPAVAGEMRVLADYRQAPTSLVMWSGPTPPGGIIAEVVELKSSAPEDIARVDIKGKIVFFTEVKNPNVRDSATIKLGEIKAALAKLGVAGIISDSTENPDLINEHYWVNSYGDAGWGFTKAGSPMPAFSITPRQGNYLRNLLTRYGKVRVKALVDSRLYSGSYPYATGVIEGTGSEEEVLELGHTTEPGASDNAAGVGSMLEAVATLNRLIEAGRLPRPRRSIRILAMPELYGSMHYVATNLDRIKRTVGAICVDSAAGPYELSGTEYFFRMNPDVARSYQDALIMRVAESYYAVAGVRRRLPHWMPWGPGTDTFLSDPLIGIPNVAASGSTGVNVHHNGADTVDRVDRRSLRDIASMLAVYLYYLANAGEPEIPWLGEITANRGYQNMVRAAEPYLDRMTKLENSAALATELFWALEKIAYTAARDQDALLSTLRLAAPDRRENVRLSLDPLLKGVQRFADDQSERLRQAANRRAGEIGAPVPVKQAAPKPDPRRAEAAQIVVKRKRIGSITFDDLPVDQREGWPAGAWDNLLQTALYWCDGKRSLAEVIRRTELELGPQDFDFVGYFRFLGRKGYVEILRTVD